MWHIRTACKKGNVANFKGNIKVHDGSIVSARPMGLEYGVRKKAKKNGILKTKDAWLVKKQGRELVLLQRTRGSFDGVDFKVNPDDGQVAPRLEFDLYINGKQRAAKVYVGHKNQHPKEVPFLVIQPD